MIITKNTSETYKREIDDALNNSQTSHGDQHVADIETLDFDPPVPKAVLFPPSLSAAPFASREEANVAPPPPSAAPLRPSAKDQQTLISSVKVLDYRYYRLLLHPDTGLWRLVRDWRDPAWPLAGVKGLRRGLDARNASQRKTFFGPNIISIQAKSILELLLDECLHPFCQDFPFHILSARQI